MPTLVNVNFLTVVHATSSGVAPSFPDVCNTPSPGGPIPIPYPNIAQSIDTGLGSLTVKADGNPIMLQGSAFMQSTGDEPGVAGGVMSMVIKGKAEFVNYSFDVKAEGKGVARLADPMIHNKLAQANTAPFPEIQPPAPSFPLSLPLKKEEENELLKVDFLNR
jgi:hypothetical protein